MTSVGSQGLAQCACLPFAAGQRRLDVGGRPLRPLPTDCRLRAAGCLLAAGLWPPGAAGLRPLGAGHWPPDAGRGCSPWSLWGWPALPLAAGPLRAAPLTPGHCLAEGRWLLVAGRGRRQWLAADRCSMPAARLPSGRSSPAASGRTAQLLAPGCWLLAAVRPLFVASYCRSVLASGRSSWVLASGCWLLAAGLLATVVAVRCLCPAPGCWSPTSCGWPKACGCPPLVSVTGYVPQAAN